MKQETEEQDTKATEQLRAALLRIGPDRVSLPAALAAAGVAPTLANLKRAGAIMRALGYHRRTVRQGARVLRLWMLSPAPARDCNGWTL